MCGDVFSFVLVQCRVICSLGMAMRFFVEVTDGSYTRSLLLLSLFRGTREEGRGREGGKSG